MWMVELRPTEPIGAPVSKFGGQPVWLAKPQWPIARGDGEPMRFICQIALPPELQCGGQRMAYIFMSENAGAATWEAEAGENAVILQPASFSPHVEVVARAQGPTLERMIPGPTGDRLVPVETEYAVELLALPDEAADDGDFAMKTRIGGPPTWYQNEDWPKGGPWRLIVQVDSCTDHYSVNFGDAGIGYAFISEDGRQGRFLWQCG